MELFQRAEPLTDRQARAMLCAILGGLVSNGRAPCDLRELVRQVADSDEAWEAFHALADRQAVLEATLLGRRQ